MKVYRASFESHWNNGVQLVTTFHGKIDLAPASGPDPSPSTIGDALSTALTTKYRACMPTWVTVDSLLIREEVDPASSDIPGEALHTIGLAGTHVVGSHPLPPPSSILVKIGTDAAVRSGRGRMWFPLQDWEDLNSDGMTVNTSGVLCTNIKAFLDTFIAPIDVPVDIGGAQWKSVVYSRTRRLRGDPNYYFGVTGYTIRNTQHWLRSRATAP